MVLVLTSFCNADSTADLAKENAELRKRVESLEEQMEQLKALVLGTAKAQPTQTTQMQLSDADLNRLSEMVRTDSNTKKPVLSKLDIELYGYIKADASYDDSRTNPGNYVVWVDDETSNKNDNEFSMTAKQTRLGFKVNGPDDGQLKTSGKAEIDFYGSGGTENKAKLQLRHAYMKLDWPADNVSIIAGQTSDIISPLTPYTLNYTVLWDAGNIGYRRPQIRLTKGFDLEGEAHLQTAVAVSRTIGDSTFRGTAVSGAQTGEDSGFPTLQGRAALTFPCGYKPTTLGVSGHWGEEKYDGSDFGTTSEDVESWSMNVDLLQPVNEWLTIKGEAFVGENLDTYFGGIGQGLNTTTGEAVKSTGGWVAATLGPWDKTKYNFGIGIDDVKESTIATGQRSLNRSIFGNVVYALNKNTDLGFEISHWHTERKNQKDADALRGQMSFIYKF